MKRILILLGGLTFVASSGFASIIQVILTPANVIGGTNTYSGPWNNGGQYNSTLILNQQAGSISEPSQSGYWLNPDGGPANAYIVIDLLAAYRIDSLELFNTHNAGFNDRGTGNFNFQAGNSVTDMGPLGFDLSGPISSLVSGTLAPVSQINDPIVSQLFSVSNSSTFRYLRFNPTSVAVGGSPCCGANNYGLNEVRVFQNDQLVSAVPEPGTMSIIGIGVAALFALRRQRAKQQQ